MNIEQQIENMIENHNVTTFDYKGFDFLASQLSDVELDKNFVELFWKCAMKFIYNTETLENSEVKLTVTFFNCDGTVKKVVNSLHKDHHNAIEVIRILKS